MMLFDTFRNKINMYLSFFIRNQDIFGSFFGLKIQHYQ